MVHALQVIWSLWVGTSVVINFTWPDLLCMTKSETRPPGALYQEWKQLCGVKTCAQCVGNH